MTMSKNMGKLVFLIGTLVIANGASAATFDGFNGWTEMSNKKNSEVIRKDRLVLKGKKKSGAASSALDTVGMNSVDLDFDWKAKKKRRVAVYVAYGDASMKDKSAWTKVFKASGKGAHSESVSFGVDGDDLKVMIISKGKKKKSVAKLKNMLISTSMDGEVGDIADVPQVEGEDLPPVPVPASFPLLIAGLGGLGFLARRKRKAA